jgi:hypothetical protein
MISKLDSEGVCLPLSTDERNARLSGRAVDACDSPNASLRDLISRPST